MHPKISIITVCKNSEDTIRYTLNSIKSQTYKNIEHIIVDNLSIDETKNIIKHYINSEPIIPITFISEKDEGIYDAINKGIKNSTGKYISILNADDIYHSNNAIENVINLLEKNQEKDIFFFWFDLF